MNKTWSYIIIFCLLYAMITSRIDELINAFYNNFNNSLNSLLSVASIIVFFNGVFSMAINGGIIEDIGKIFNKLSRFIFKDIRNKETINYISMNITALILGLGLATTPIAFKILDNMKKELKSKNILLKNIMLLSSINITSFTLFPLTIISLREKYNSNIGYVIWITLVLISFITSTLSLIVIRNMKYELFD